MTDRPRPGARVRVTDPSEPAFLDRTGRLVRPHPEGGYWCRLDEFPDHQHRFFPAGHPRQDWVWLHDGEFTVEAGPPPRPARLRRAGLVRRVLCGLAWSLFGKGGRR